MTSPHTHPAERETPAGEAMREAVARDLIRAKFGEEGVTVLFHPPQEATLEQLATLSARVQEAHNHAAFILRGAGPIASELARLTERAEVAEGACPGQRCASVRERERKHLQHVERLEAAIRQTQDAAEAALTTLRADHAAEVARLQGAAALALQELDWQVEQAAHCGDPNYECPMQDIHAPGDGHLLARNALRAALATTETTNA